MLTSWLSGRSPPLSIIMIENVEVTAVSGDEELDYNWVTDRLALGGAIYTRRNMDVLARAGVTHIVSLQAGFDDSRIALGSGIEVEWAPCVDDLQPKPPELFAKAIGFTMQAWRKADSKIYFHCVEGARRSPMMLLAFLGAQGMRLTEAMELISSKRPKAEFPVAYRQSVVRFLASYREQSSKGV
jgi:protein-tyrosine phosphatase